MAPTIMMMIGDDAGDDEVAALQILVEPDPDAPLHGRLDLFHALAVEEIGEKLLVVALDEGGDVAPGDAGEVRVAAVEQDLQRRSPGPPGSVRSSAAG